MKHLEDEDIARMIDGKISKHEREGFLEHLSGCDMCLTVYNESLKFVEKEAGQKYFLPMPNLRGIVDRFWQPVKSIFSVKRLIPVYAILLIAIILLPFLLLKENVQVHYIEKSMSALEIRGIHTFSNANDPIFASIRAGIFMEDLSILIDYGGKKDLKGKVVQGLLNELRIIFNEEIEPVLPDLVNVEEEETFETVSQRILAMLAQRSLVELFQFGNFIEQSILDSLENGLPSQEEVEKYRRLIVDKYKNKLPGGVLKELNKFKNGIGVREGGIIFLNIKEIFLSAE